MSINKPKFILQPHLALYYIRKDDCAHYLKNGTLGRGFYNILWIKEGGGRLMWISERGRQGGPPMWIILL